MKKVLKIASVCSLLVIGLNAQVIHLKNGWNNIGITENTFARNFNNPSIKYMWKYDSNNGKWDFYSNNTDYNNQVREWINEGRNYGFFTSLQKGEAVWIKSDRTFDINVAPMAYTDVKGFVKDAITNQPINSFDVIIDNQEKSFNDVNGTFDFPDVPVSRHNITIVAPGYQPAHVTINIANSEPVNLGQIKLIPQTASHKVEVTGEILDAVNGNVITEPVRLRIFNGYNNTSGTPLVDITVNNGEYDIKNLPAGNYTLVLDANGYYETTYNYTFASNENVIRQDLVMSPKDTNVNYVLRATLTWGEYPTDLDSHLLAYAPDSNHSVWHIYYDNAEVYDGGKKVADLDVDDTDSFGPEHITLYDLNNSMKYVYYVWRYSDDGELKNSNAEVRVYYKNHLYDFHVPYKNGRGWKVFEIDNGVLIPCQTNCMVPDTVTNDEFESWKANPNNEIINELINTANTPK